MQKYILFFRLPNISPKKRTENSCGVLPPEGARNEIDRFGCGLLFHAQASSEVATDTDQKRVVTVCGQSNLGGKAQMMG